MESNPRTHILSKKNCLIQYLYLSPSVRSLTSADYCANPPTPNITVSMAGVSPCPLRLPIWHQSSHLACNSNQKITQTLTANFAFFTLPTEASYLTPIKPPGMQFKPENHSDSKLCLFHPAKKRKSQHKVLSINTLTVTRVMSNGN